MKFNLILVLITIIVSSLYAQSKKQLDHDVYDFWNRPIQHAISDNGKWFLYAVKPDNGDGKLTFKNLQDETEFVVARGDSAAFSKDASFAAFLIRAKLDSVKKAGKDEKKGKDAPQDSLAVIDLSSGNVSVKDVIKSYKMPEDAGGWLAWQLKFTKEAEDSSKAENDPAKTEETKKDKKKDEKVKAIGDTLYVLNGQTQQQYFYEHVTACTFSKNGRYLAMAFASKDSLHDGLAVLNLEKNKTDTLMHQPGDYKNLTWDETGRQLAFISNSDSFKTEQQSHALYLWQTETKKLKRIAAEKTPGVPSGWWISEFGKIEFSKNSERLYFATAPRPEPEPKDDSLDELPKLDVWHWQDPLTQPMQLKQLDAEKKRSYSAVYDIGDKKITQLATIEIPDVTLSAEGDGDYALGLSNLPYRREISWDYPKYYDYFIIDVRTGKSKKVKEKVQSKAHISPGGKYIYWWDRDILTWKIMSTKGQKEFDAGQNISVALQNELHDEPYKADAYGAPGWTKNDEQFIFYDRFDLWAFDPTSVKKAVNITHGFGRKSDLRLRYIKLDKEEKFINRDEPVLLSAFHDSTKQAGFYKLNWQQNRDPQQLIYAAKHFSTPIKAKDADVLCFTREDYVEFPDFRVSDLNFQNPRKISDINPQQKDYLWGTAEQFQWHALDGQLLQGILCKPENFDPAKKYPMMVYFYERNSDGLYRHHMPEAHRSVINRTFYTSRGYLVFIPDILYKIGYPGQSAYNAVIPGVTKLIETGFVDANNIGVQGHSWGGYQIAYLVTQTNIFKAAEAGAPVSNMTSAYGGIRWETGKSRNFQYEETQSRIGGTLWEKPMQFIENSPLFWLEKVETPLLIMHNDHDGHVPWEQGIELFNGLRRLHKPAWMIVYNDQPHWPVTFVNKRDWQIRLQQFFDYYLKGAPQPVWIKEGIPAIKKGKTLGTEFAE